MKQQIKGGLGKNLNPKDVDPNELRMGIQVEKEHTPNESLAKEIALDHLAEDPHYYTKLKSAKLENKMNKKSIHELIKEIAMQEMARIPMLFQLSSEDPAEIEAKIPDDLKNSSAVKNIIKYYTDNQNSPASTVTVAKYWGYPSQQGVNTQFQRLRNAGVLKDAGFAAAKKEKPTEPGMRGRSITSLDDRSDSDKIKYIISKFKKDEEPNTEYREWFITTHGEENLENLRQLIDNYKQSKTKEEASLIKQQIVKLLSSLGMSFAQRGRKPMERKPVTDLGNHFEDPTIDDDDTEMSENNPKIAPRPGIAEPITRPEIRPKRRTLTPPDPDAKPTPKNEILKKLSKDQINRLFRTVSEQLSTNYSPGSIVNISKLISNLESEYLEGDPKSGYYMTDPNEALDIFSKLPNTFNISNSDGEEFIIHKVGKDSFKFQPKTQNESQKYGWDQKKGLTQIPKPEVKGKNTPKQTPKNESIINKITQRYLKGK